ncbi:HD-GYP domain-containing protein [Halopseudomonas sp.]|uniref:HD-GYP domain-containing protein n=1 Tax=Halopseudomonas sp. TaxID=2901191 RepID=UPI00356148D9
MRKKITSDLHQVRIHPSQLQMGMYVCMLDRPWLDTPFLFQGFLLSHEDDLFALRNLCEYLYIDLSLTRVDVSTLEPLKAISRPGPQAHPISVDIEQEIGRAGRAYRRSLSEIKALLQCVHDDQNIDVEAMILAVRECLDSIIRNPSALLWLSRIKHVDQYTAEHCVNVGIQAMALGRHLGIGIKHIELLGICGMLHDVGKMGLDQDVLNKAGRLTSEEVAHLRLHPVFGRDQLSKDPKVPQEVIKVAYSHHERMDGRGYPEKRPGHSLDFYVRAITIVDAYDAMTSKRCYSAGKSPAAALKVLYSNIGTQFDGNLVIKFIECIGLYPPGSLVEMSSGEVGVVLSVDPRHRLAPKVSLLLDGQKRSMQQVIVDLRFEPPASAGGMTVASVLPDGSHGIELETFSLANINMVQ